MVIGTKKEKFWGVLIATVLIFGGVVLLNRITGNSDPYTFQHNGKTLTLDITSLYSGGTSINQVKRTFSHEIVDDSNVIIYCNYTENNYYIFNIIMNETTYDIQATYSHYSYLDVEYPVDSKISYDISHEFEFDNKEEAEDKVTYLSLEGTIIINSS